MKIIVYWISLFLPLFSYGDPVSPYKAKILNISTQDQKVIDVTFDKRNLLAQTKDGDERYETNNGVLHLPISFSPDHEVNKTFYVFEEAPTGLERLGEIAFVCYSRELYWKLHRVEFPNYIVVRRCSFALPQAVDSFGALRFDRTSFWDRIELLKEITAFRSDAAAVFSRGPIVDQCSLLTAFIWSLDPLVSAPGHHLPIGAVAKIRGLREKKFGLLCAGFRDLFVEIAAVAMPNVPVRKVDAYRWYYPDCINITVNSHALLEVFYDGNWWLFDPTFRFYLTTAAGDPLSASDVRFLKEENRLTEIKVVHIPTVRPPTDLFDDTNYAYDLFNGNYWCFFNWINYFSP